MIVNMPPLNRPAPALAPEFFKTYDVRRPRSTHFRKATCAEVDCPNRERGWRTTCDVSTVLGQQQANYIRMKSGRHFTTKAAGDMVSFTFPPGQECFSQHTRPLDREPFFRVIQGDWREYGRGQRLDVRAWLDNFGEHQERLAEQVRRSGIER